VAFVEVRLLAEAERHVPLLELYLNVLSVNLLSAFLTFKFMNNLNYI
jgi:hypothetical protein